MIKQLRNYSFGTVIPFVLLHVRDLRGIRLPLSESEAR